MVQHPQPDWFFVQWMRALGTNQADVGRETGFPKSKMSLLASGKRKYDRDVVNEIARALHIAPFELLMHPDDAMALRRLRDTALTIAAEKRTPFTVEPADGTYGH